MTDSIYLGQPQPDGGWFWSHNTGQDVEVHDVVEPTAVPEPIDMERVRTPGGALSSSDAVSLVTVFERRAHVMRSVLFPMRGAMRELHCRESSVVRLTRGWKLSMFLHRMLLFRPPRGRMVPGNSLARIRLFQDGQWLQLLGKSSNCAEKVHQNDDDDDGEAKKAARVLSLVRVGELSVARQALDANGILVTLAALTDLQKRPQLPRQELSQEVVRTERAVQFELDELEFFTCLSGLV